MLAIATGCVSAVDPVLGSAARTPPPAQDLPLNVASASAAAAGTDASAPANLQPQVPADLATGATQPQDLAAQAMELAPGAAAVDPAQLANVAVPVPAPRDASAAGGVALAFAESGQSPVADAAAAVAQPVAGEQVSSATSTSNSPVNDALIMQSTVPAQTAAQLEPVKKPASLYEFLKQRKLQREAQLRGDGSAKPQVEPAAPARVASLAQPPVHSALEDAGRPASAAQDKTVALPGVHTGNELFGITAEDAAEEEDFNSIEVASAAGMSRMSPNGLLTQTEHVQVGCFKPELVSLLKRIEQHYKRPLMVTSGYRSTGENRRAGGARKSMHLLCQAADIQIEGVSKWDLAKYLRSVQGRGGVGTYCRTELVHIDVGPERDWHHPCRRAKKRRA